MKSADVRRKFIEFHESRRDLRGKSRDGRIECIIKDLSSLLHLQRERSH